MSYTKQDIELIVNKQREYFLSNETLDIKFRIDQLRKLKKALIDNEKLIIEALCKDLGRSEAEAYFCDFGSVILELNETIKGIKKWAKPENHFSGFICFPSFRTKVYKMPYGVSLIISPFNFPFMLSIGVLIPCIAGGNTAVIKASSKSSESTKVLMKLISETFDSKYVTVIDGGHDVADYCLETRFDKVFYTGSPRVGRHVLECASRNLTPVALELGGETGNWCIVRKDADLKDAARKIAFFKALNSGQICINVNQVAVEKEVARKFVEELKREFVRQLGNDIINNPEYPRLINKAAFDKCVSELENYKDLICFGGKYSEETLKVSPTVLYPVDINETLVNHELFNPLLPVVEFDDVDKLLDVISRREHGLALYLFTKDIKWAKKVMSSMQYGGGCINEVCVHMMVKGVPFNGTGHSGMGAYHGEYGFKEFTHPCTVLFGKNKGNLSLREHPYSDKKMKFIKRFEK